MKTIENIEIVKWQGIKDCDTKKVCGGYLWLKFNEDTKLLNINPNVIGAQIREYKKGKSIGFQLFNVHNRSEAITNFFLHHQICH